MGLGCGCEWMSEDVGKEEKRMKSLQSSGHWRSNCHDAKVTRNADQTRRREEDGKSDAKPTMTGWNEERKRMREDLNASKEWGVSQKPGIILVQK